MKIHFIGWSPTAQQGVRLQRPRGAAAGDAAGRGHGDTGRGRQTGLLLLPGAADESVSIWTVRQFVCPFQTKDCAAMSSSSLRVGTQVRCNAWLLDEAAKIPYLVSTQWRDGGQVERATLERIQGMPDMADMQVCRL